MRVLFRSSPGALAELFHRPEALEDLFGDLFVLIQLFGELFELIRSLSGSGAMPDMLELRGRGDEKPGGGVRVCVLPTPPW